LRPRRLLELDRPLLFDDPLDDDDRTRGWLLLREGALLTDRPLELGRDLTCGRLLPGELLTSRLGALLTVRLGADVRFGGEYDGRSVVARPL
jgi:hypothetical protein